MSYTQLPTRIASDTNSAADANQLQLNIEALKGGTPATAPTTTIEGLATAKAATVATPSAGKVAKVKSDGNLENGANAEADLVTASGTLTSGDILTGAGSKGAQASAKQFEDTPTDSTAKVTTSQWLYRQSGQDTTWYSRTVSTGTVTPTNSTTNNQWHPTSIQVVSLPAGTYRIYFKAIVSGVAATSCDFIYIGVSDENADNVTPTFADSIQAHYSSTNTTNKYVTFTGEFIATLATTKTLTLKAKPNFTGTITTFSILGGVGSTILEAKRMY